ncbi:hypothetical protein FQA47_011562 [Oryzias melastigma]|uniref:Uncharacterized protein n=1 Tax=Oryzias melastigma TaxID=30732 RepID=A0A834BXZ5_ORYME|nr:hypothetical protein FQA47_011562 [Oryzias melastigma]
MYRTLRVRSGSRAGSVCLSHIYFPEPRLLLSLGAGTRLSGPAHSDGRRSDFGARLRRGSADRTDAARRSLCAAARGFLRTNRYQNKLNKPNSPLKDRRLTAARSGEHVTALERGF